MGNIGEIIHTIKSILVQNIAEVNTFSEKIRMIGERIKSERTRLGFNQPDFAAIAGASKRTLIDWEKDVSSPTAVQLSALFKAGVNVLYVLTGVSDKAQNDVPPSDDEFSYIPVRDVVVSAGHGANNQAEEVLYHFAYRKDWLKSRGLFEKDLEIIVVRGDSMEPTINDGDSILINTAENDPQDGHIYVIRGGDTLWVKRAQRQFDGGLLLLSDNKTYPPMRLDLETLQDVQVIGKVVNSSKNFY